MDYEKSGILVFLENILILIFWVYIGTECSGLCINSQKRSEYKKNPLLPVIFIMTSIILGLVLNMVSGESSKQDFGGAGWNSSEDVSEWLELNGLK